MNRRFSLRDVRTRLLVVVVAALALGLGLATVGFNLLVARSAARDADALLRERADSERSLVQTRGGSLRVTEHTADRIGDSRVWIFEGDRQLEGPPPQAAAAAAVRSLVRGPSRYVTLAQTDERLFSLPVTHGGRRYGTIVTGLSLAPYERSSRVSLLASIGLASTLLLVVGAAVWWLLRSALRPVARMTEQASTWSETDLAARFHLGEPHDELTRLAWTLDLLLDRIAASLRHERLVTAELSHELRTPLAKLRAEAEIALRRPRSAEDYAETLRGVVATADRIEGIVETLLAAARQEGDAAHGIADARSVAEAATRTYASLAEARGVALTVDEAPPVKIGVDAAFAERVLAPVIDNACRYARSSVHVAVARTDGDVQFVVTDDGPGVVDGEDPRIFEPATRGTAGRASGEGAGLGLALARRLARAAAGDVETAPAERGARFVVRLPTA